MSAQQQTAEEDSVSKYHAPPDNVIGLSIGIFVTIVVVALIMFVISLVGGVRGLNMNCTALGIMAIVFAFVPPLQIVGFIFGCILLARKTPC